MQTDSLAFELILNIALLVLVATLLSKIRIIQELIPQEIRSWKSQVFLSGIFGLVIILSIYTGIQIDSYNMNTRLIGAMAAGILGGPIVGLYASLIGAVYAYFLSGPAVFSMAMAFSTVLFGLLGGGFYPYFQRGKWKYRDLFGLACFAEVCDMICILRMVRPFDLALGTVLESGPLMMVMNAVGILLFISSFTHIFIHQDIESSRQLQIASELSKKCLPLLEDGLGNPEKMEALATVILEETTWSGVIVTDRDHILAWKQEENGQPIPNTTGIPDVGKQTMKTGEIAAVYQVSRNNSWYEWMKEYSLIAAPLMIEKRPIGSLIICAKKQWVFRQSEVELLQNLTAIASAQFAISELARQRSLRQQAELKALQFQVNPHFLFNALNTISYVCRENGDRARELLVILANYFRYNLDGGRYMVPLSEELDHVRDYLELEKARFEDKLEMVFEVPEVSKLPDILVPSLILQPIVENAVRYGISGDGKRRVRLKILEEETVLRVAVSDQGRGFPKDVLKKLEQEQPGGKSIGLNNVNQRMKRTYGEEGGIRIHSSEKGSCVELCFQKGMMEVENT